MRVNIDEIKEAGLDRSWEFTRQQVDEVVIGAAAGYRSQGAVEVQAHLERVSQRVLVRARCRTQLTAPCGRCLTPVAVQVPVDFSLTLRPAEREAEEHGEPKSRHAGSFTGAEADEETYASKEIDLDPFVQEQIQLALPTYPLCGESCKGLCTVCGQNLNERECGCDRHVADPRWAGLEKFRTKSKQQ